MKYLIIFSLMILYSFSSKADVQHGNGTSGGGGALVCRDGNGIILSSHLLDLWEGEQLLNLNIIKTNESVDMQVNRALEKLGKADSLLASKTYDLMIPLFSHARILGDDVSLPAPTDADSRYQKKGCPLEGMMYYDGELDQLQIDQTVFNKLATNTDIAASKIHEAIYYVIRNRIVPNSFNHTPRNSVPVRKLVACLFSSNKECLFPALSKEQILNISESVYHCENSKLSYYLVKKNSVLESISPSYGCTGKTDEQWIGLLDKVENQVLGTPNLFVVYRNDRFFQLDTCSALRRYGYSIGLKVRRNNLDDPIDGHPVLEMFSEQSSQQSQFPKYGTPACKKVK